MERGIKISLLLKDAPPRPSPALFRTAVKRSTPAPGRSYNKSARASAQPPIPIAGWRRLPRRPPTSSLVARPRATRCGRAVAHFSISRGLRILTVLGPSGSGKSSLARAGLLPRLRRDRCPAPADAHRHAASRVATAGAPRAGLLQVRRCEAGGGEPSAAAISQLNRELGRCDADGIYDRLRLEIALWPDSDRSPLLLLVDQLEEIYTQASDAAARHAFIEGLLHAAADPARQVMVILTLRSDFIGETMAHRPLNRAIGESHVLVTAMPPAELRRAIAEPARRAQRPIDAPTIDLILSEALGSAGALPLLQFALHRVFEGMQAGRPAFATLREIGGVGVPWPSARKDLRALAGPLNRPCCDERSCA